MIIAEGGGKGDGRDNDRGDCSYDSGDHSRGGDSRSDDSDDGTVIAEVMKAEAIISDDCRGVGRGDGSGDCRYDDRGMGRDDACQ